MSVTSIDPLSKISMRLDLDITVCGLAVRLHEAVGVEEELGPLVSDDGGPVRGVDLVDLCVCIAGIDRERVELVCRGWNLTIRFVIVDDLIVVVHDLVVVLLVLVVDVDIALVFVQALRQGRSAPVRACPVRHREDPQGCRRRWCSRRSA